MVEITFLVEKWGEPWNEGYKNLAKYTYQLLRNIPGVNVKVLSKENFKTKELRDSNSIWIFNYPETIKTISYLTRMKLCTKKPIVKFQAKREININLKEEIKTILYRKHLWDVLITTTNLLKLELTRYFRTSKIFSLPPPIPTDYFYPMKKELVRKALALRDDLLYVGYCGKINEHVRLDIIAKSLKNDTITKDIVLLLAISHFKTKNDAYRLLSFLKGSGANVRFIRVQDVRMFYCAVDLLLYPVEREGSVEPPLTLLEAMSCGTPVVALKTPVVEKIIVNEQNGFYFSDCIDLKSVIENIVRNPNILYHISSKARETILESFSFNRLHNAYYRFLVELERLAI